jgi:ABC-type Fe3+ transport system permease subunit
MNPNPYKAGTASIAAPKTRATRWMIVSGAIALLLAALCFVATVVGMILSFDTIATSSSTPKASELASGISTALYSSISAALLAIVGIVLLILGFVRRQLVASS